MRPMMILTNSQHDGESRFAHLLQPIRDLATNWDIDLASELEDYLSEVRPHYMSFVFHKCIFTFTYILWYCLRVFAFSIQQCTGNVLAMM